VDKILSTKKKGKGKPLEKQEVKVPEGDTPEGTDRGEGAGGRTRG
jgi:hypothetical protein